jgi:alanyl-tRNA synthetase
VVDQVKEERQRREKAEMAALSGARSKDDAAESIDIAGIDVWIKNFGVVDQKAATTALDNQAAGKSAFVGLVAVLSDGKVTFIVKAGSDAVKRGVHAGNLVREVAKIAGGGGGGRPDFATAGGKSPDRVDEALESVPGLLRSMIQP